MKSRESQEYFFMIQLDDATYERYRLLLQERVGLYFGPDKKRDLERHIATILRKDAARDPEELYRRLYTTASHGPLWEAFISELTVGETYFFRDRAQIKALQEDVLPSIIKKRQENGNFSIRLWSAGCASGEEPYTLAMLLYELIPEIQRWSISILATDINQYSLERAEQGLYGKNSFRNETPEGLQERYFERTDHGWQLIPEIRRAVRFDYLNLAEATYPSFDTLTTGMDLIICRNVTIYFQLDTTREIVRRFHDCLLPGGWLIVGHSEPLSTIYQGFDVRNYQGAVLYQKPATLEINWGKKESAPEPVWKIMDSQAMLPEVAATPEVALERQPEPVIYEEPEPEEILSAEACYQKAKSLADQRQWDEAHRWLTEALELNSMMAEAYFTRAMVYLHQDDDQSAAESLRRALYVDRNFVLAYFNMGLIHTRRDNKKQALKAWKAARDILDGMREDEPLPYGDGIVAGYLHRLVNNYINEAS